MRGLKFDISVARLFSLFSMQNRITAPLISIWLCVFSSLTFAVEIAHEHQRTFTQMLELGDIRMGVPYERIVYVQSKNQILGAAPDISHYLSQYLSKKYNKRIQVSIVPSPSDKLINLIDENTADFALVYSHEYDQQLKSKKYLTYQHPYYEESLIASKAGTPPINSLLDLSGRVVCVGRLKDTAALDEANKTLIKSGKKPIIIYQDKHVLDDEDFLQMLNSDLISYTYVAKWKAKLWEPVFTHIQANENTTSAKGSPLELVVSHENKALAEEIISFIASPDLKEAMDLFRKREFDIRKNALKNPLTPLEWQRFESMYSYFKLYGKQNQLDPLFLAGLGFQESLLNQKAVSPSGAIGVMQLLPSTGKSLHVGDIHQLQPNIHAGAKYMNSLIYALSIDGDLSDVERSFFAVAAYNTGPGNVSKAREEAAQMGFNPNKWFGNVEMATAKLFGSQTFLYVRNVYKYYVAYDLRTNNASITAEKFILEETKK